MPTYTIADLVALTGVPPATVHYYLRIGLLPRPKRSAPNRFAYDQRHVRSLHLIRTLRERRGLSLPMIKRILPELLQLETTDAFLPEMWDRALAPRMAGRGRPPGIRLLEAATEAFSRKGYDAVNVDEICRTARMAKGSFYRHYRSKEELFFAAAESAAAEVATRFRESAGEATLPVDAAGAVLWRFLEPRLPLFLDLFARSLQRRPGYAAGARRAFAETAAQIGLAVAGEGSATERGARAVGAAVFLAFRQVLDVGAAAAAGPAAEAGSGRKRRNDRTVPPSPSTPAAAL